MSKILKQFTNQELMDAHYVALQLGRDQAGMICNLEEAGNAGKVFLSLLSHHHIDQVLSVSRGQSDE